MSIYYEKARELGDLILQSEQSLRLADATAEFKQSEEAQIKMNEYKAYQGNIQESMSKGVMSQDDFKIATKRLTEMAVEVKQDPVIGALIFAENEFNGFVNQVMNVLKMTITGESQAGCGEDSCSGCASSGGCSSCSETE